MLKAKEIKVNGKTRCTVERKDEESGLIKIDQIYVSAREGFTLVEIREDHLEVKQVKKGKGKKEEREIIDSFLTEAFAYAGAAVEITFDLEDDEAEDWPQLFFGDGEFEEGEMDE